MIRNIRAILPHGAILICNMYIVFFLIDRVNTAMCFIDNEMTKALLVIMCVISMGASTALIRAQRRADKARARRMKRKKSASNVVEYKKHTNQKAA